jgi:hypothetical protein
MKEREIYIFHVARPVMRGDYGAIIVQAKSLDHAYSLVKDKTFFLGRFAVTNIAPLGGEYPKRCFGFKINGGGRSSDGYVNPSVRVDPFIYTEIDLS